MRFNEFIFALLLSHWKNKLRFYFHKKGTRHLKGFAGEN